MLRTRDYALLLATITFLVVGITTTVLTKGGFSGVGGMTASVFEATEEPTSYEAIVSEKVEPSREGRIASLREKIAKLGLSEVDTSPEPEEVPATVPEATEEETEAIAEQTCSYYGLFASAWNPSGLLIEEVEGGRLVYREVTNDATGSSTVPVVKKDIALQLAVRSVPLPTQHCIPSDVIGIATNGALIRNGEVAMYSEYGPNMLIGYALDGFPMYGASSAQTDVCGGMMVSGQYRYVVHSDRDTIITCFAGIPASL
jgi:hypothetical protein